MSGIEPVVRINTEPRSEADLEKLSFHGQGLDFSLIRLFIGRVARSNHVERSARYMERAGQRFESLSQWRNTLATAGVALLALLLGVHVVFGENGMMTYERKRAESRQLQKDIERLQEENLRMTQHIRELKSNPKAIEKEAREQLRYVRPGEVIYTVPETRQALSNAK
jgi:cell division protein FtsB